MQLISMILRVSTVVVSICTCRMWRKNEATFTTFKSFILSIYVYVGIFISNSEYFYSHIQDSPSVLSSFTLIVYVIWTFFLFVGCMAAIVYLNRKIPNAKGKVVTLVYVSLFICLVLSTASFYFGLYVIQPDWFVISDTAQNNIFSLTFEFVYFTITSAISYSGDGIELVGVLPKLVHIAYILFFYLIAANLIVSLANNGKDDST